MITSDATIPAPRAIPALRRMSEPEFTLWLARAIPVYAAEKVASGQWAETESLALSQEEHNKLLPQGLASPDNHLFSIVDTAGEPVGTLWFAVKTRFSSRIAYVFDVSIFPDRRRQGHAHRALIALEAEVRRLGLAGIALHVFGHNAAARALYAGLGFQPTSINLYKPVGPAGGDEAASRCAATGIAPGFSIAPTTTAHFAELHHALDIVAREQRYLALLQAPPREQSFAFYRNIVDNDLCQFVVLAGDRVVGWCDILPLFGESRAHVGTLGIGLLPEARHKGLGAHLLRTAIDKAWAKGMTRIELSVRSDNLNAKALYERFGFQVEGIRRRASLVAGEYHDMVSMALLRGIGA